MSPEWNVSSLERMGVGIWYCLFTVCKNLSASIYLPSQGRPLKYPLYMFVEEWMLKYPFLRTCRGRQIWVGAAFHEFF